MVCVPTLPRSLQRSRSRFRPISKQLPNSDDEGDAIIEVMRRLAAELEGDEPPPVEAEADPWKYVDAGEADVEGGEEL